MLSLQYLQYTCELAHSVVFPLLTYLSTQRDCNSREGHRCLRNENYIMLKLKQNMENSAKAATKTVLRAKI